MSSTQLTSLSYVLLALIGEGGAAPHDIVDMVRRGGYLHWSAAPSQMYAEPKRLEKLGYLTSRREAGRRKGGERTVYTLTPQGRGALVEWLAQPAAFPRTWDEAQLRLLAGNLLDDATILHSLRNIRDEIARLNALTDESERVARRWPERERDLRLRRSLVRRRLAAYSGWLDEVERELGGSEAPGRPQDGPVEGQPPPPL
jgi:PadR family transcriptional regulator, regulatory protein AphA